MISLKTNLIGRLRNTSLPKNKGLLPLYEAVVNSIHSIEEVEAQATSNYEGKITIEVLRAGQTSLEMNAGLNEKNAEDPDIIIGFKITDNGVGFHDKNVTSFSTLDSDYKSDKGCRGVGRLMWLKAFENVEIESKYKDDNGLFKKRKFLFNASMGEIDQTSTECISGSNLSTCIQLKHFKKLYAAATRKTAETIADDLLEHCLWYFVRKGGAPKILVKDGADQTIDLDTVYEKHMVTSATKEAIKIKDKVFDLVHIKLRTNKSKPHIIALCAASRLITEENINSKIPGLHGKLADSDSVFRYACYVSSDLLDNSVRSERTGFDMDEKAEGLFAQTEVAKEDILKAVMNCAAKYLSKYLIDNQRKAEERIRTFVSNHAPRYRSILSRISKDKLNIDPNISNKDLELYLHKQLSEIEQKLLDAGHEILTVKNNETTQDYKERLQKYLNVASDIKMSDLAGYVSHRKVIIELMKKAIQSKFNEKYVTEDIIHELIMPMRATTDDVMSGECNLWLIDERLAFHNYLASDKTLRSMPITGSKETKEPDICALKVFDNPILISDGKKLPLASIVVVEIKRPMRNDAAPGEEKDPIDQALGYLERIRNGDVKTAMGRPIPGSKEIPGYCYALCDLTPTVEKCCKKFDLTLTSDGTGYFGYHKSYNGGCSNNCVSLI